ncbi:trichohyalin-like [Pogonomyrmex barbatus]|uniref:Trichohyalin-like n=1 Tax=Pogonomyrmex barbatus TaxID=144034 RepID=A0A6I9W6U3_9HYME|nr:trichohyalin-like [Pogonomyrmex barbatus]
MTTRKDIKLINTRKISKGMAEMEIVHGGSRWRIVTVYSHCIEETMEVLLEGIQEEKESHLIIGALEEIKNMKEGDRIESDHVPLEVELEGADRKKERRSNTIEKVTSVWTEEGIQQYHEKCIGWKCEQTESGRIWKELEEKVKKSITKVKKKIALWKIGRRTWHSKEWNKKKRELRKELGRLKRGKISREEFVQKRKEYRDWCKKEKHKHEREEEERIKAIRTEEEAWRYINKYRKKKEGISESIEIERWTTHFMELLDGSKDKIIMKEEEEEKKTKKAKQEREKEENELTREEIIKQLIELKKRKAPGENEIENEAWRLMSKEIGETFVMLLNKIWKGEGIPQEWNNGLISPIYKRREKNEVTNYRGMTLMDTAYKIYAKVLNERLKKEIEKNLKEGQFGFREGRGTIDAVYTLNYVANRELARKKGNAFFADLKAAFDKVDRKKLGEMIEKQDDIVLLATSEQELKGMMKRFRKYIQKKDLLLSPGKSKVLVFERGRGRRGKREWRWGEEDIEEVKEMKYLGYIIQKNGRAERYLEERMKRAMIAMKQTWSIGEKLFKNDFERRMKMFNALVESIALYGAEIEGHRILLEETKIREIRIEVIRRASKYEETNRKTNKKLVTECIREIEKGKRESEESKWEKKRRIMMEKSEPIWTVVKHNCGQTGLWSIRTVINWNGGQSGRWSIGSVVNRDGGQTGLWPKETVVNRDSDQLQRRQYQCGQSQRGQLEL